MQDMERANGRVEVRRLAGPDFMIEI